MKPYPSISPQAPFRGDISWWKDAVIYQILVDRFCRAGSAAPCGDPSMPMFCGGNLQGVTERLDYLRCLGVNTLWLSPINCTTAYHGYHITDYEDIEPRFGGLAAFSALLEAAKPDLRIVMDWVPNHVHRTHPFFQEALRKRASRYRDWFYFDKNENYLCFLDISDLPKLNLDHPDARNYMIECCLHWLDFGVDGFRLDHVLGPSLQFWSAFRTAIKGHKPSAILFGEAVFTGVKRAHLNTLKLPHKSRYFLEWQRGISIASAIMREYSKVFDGVLDFEFQKTMIDEVAHARRSPSVLKIQELLDVHYAEFSPEFSLPSFLDSHDSNRFLFEARNNKRRLKQAAIIQFEQHQPPIIYYGTEVGMSQTRSIAGPHGDIRARSMMPWKNQDLDMLRFYTDLIHQRAHSRIHEVSELHVLVD